MRALVRAGSPREFESDGVELAFGDLREPESLVAACQGMATVVSTANAVVPRDKATFAQVEETGYDNLLDACRAENVRRFIFMSVVPTPHDKSVTTFRMKRRIEERIQGSGLAYSIFRGDFFMDDWFALMGSTIPLRGAKAHTLRRPFWFAKGFMKFAGTSIEKRGIALVPGDGKIPAHTRGARRRRGHPGGRRFGAGDRRERESGREPRRARDPLVRTTSSPSFRACWEGP